MTLDVTDLRFAYPGRPPVLRGVSLRVPAGECGFLLGASGIGKSTLLRCVAGLESAYTGVVRAQGERIDALPPHRRRVGMLFQEGALFPHLTALGNVAFGLRYVGVPRYAREAEATRWLTLVGLADRAQARVDELSGGERQRVALARTLAAKPRVVLLDEPLSALDSDLRESLGARVKAILREQGVAALWVTHDRAEAARLADHAWQLADGKAVPLPARRLAQEASR